MKHLRHALIFFCASVLAAQAFAGNVNQSGVLLHGYDPVAYFQGTPAQGSTKHSVVHDDETYLFTSEKNRQTFLLSPDKYTPAYGGFCAFGVRMGSKFDIDPEAYEIVDDKLYVLLNRATESLWLEDPERNIKIADNLWPSIEHIPADQLEAQSN